VLQDKRPELVILGPSEVTALNVRNLSRDIRSLAGPVPMLIIAGNSAEEFAIAALRAGVQEYVKHPFEEQEFAIAVERSLAYGVEVRDGLPWVHAPDTGPNIIGDSAAMWNVKQRLARLALTDTTILVTGETGTGKELVAELVHRTGARRDRPFTTVNCAAIPDNLLESELFGYEKGAFTGAQHSKAGKLQAADGGTVFLDEIGEMSSYAQAKILRMIEGKEVQRLGRNASVPIDVRIVAATNLDLDHMVKEDRFRKDLFYRLNVARVHLPPLRERKEDLLLLVQHYIRYFNQRFGRTVLGLCDEAMEYLLAYDWPGNVREVKNLIEAIFAELPPGETSLSHVPIQVLERCAAGQCTEGDERSRLLSALSSTNWNKSKAAGKLNWSRMTLYRKIARYHIVHV
jgi:DNA-binding NtrC family response regulator